MLKIRLQRIGKKGQAYFRMVVTEHTTRPKGKYLELLGSYDPHKNIMDVKADRVKYWISKGAQLSATANNLLVGRKLIEGEKVQVWKAKASSKNQEVSSKEESKSEPKTEPKEEAQSEVATEAPSEASQSKPAQPAPTESVGEVKSQESEVPKEAEVTTPPEKPVPTPVA